MKLADDTIPYITAYYLCEEGRTKAFWFVINSHKAFNRYYNNTNLRQIPTLRKSWLGTGRPIAIRSMYLYIPLPLLATYLDQCFLLWPQDDLQDHDGKKAERRQ